MKVELSEKEINRLSSAMLMYLFSYDRRNCDCVICENEKKFNDQLLRKLEHILDENEKEDA